MMKIGNFGCNREWLINAWKSSIKDVSSFVCFITLIVLDICFQLSLPANELFCITPMSRWPSQIIICRFQSGSRVLAELHKYWEYVLTTNSHLYFQWIWFKGYVFLNQIMSFQSYPKFIYPTSSWSFYSIVFMFMSWMRLYFDDTKMKHLFSWWQISIGIGV